MFVGDMDTAIAESRAAAGDKYVNVTPNERTVAQSSARASPRSVSTQACSEVMVSVLPVLLGDGTRLFEEPGGKTVRLELVSVTHTTQVTNMWYRVVDTGRPH
jgi:hypothetical protein